MKNSFKLLKLPVVALGLLKVSNHLEYFPRISPTKWMNGSSPIFDKSRSPTPMAADEDPMINTTSSHGNSPFFTEFYPGASKIFGSGPTFMDQFDNDQFSKERQAHSHYPFASKDEWQMASFLLRSGLSMAALDQFFKLELVRDLLLLAFQIEN